MQTLKVLLVDPHEIVRQGLRALLRRLEDVEVVGEAANGHAALQVAADLCPDVVIADFALPQMGVGIENLRAVFPEVRVVAFTAASEAGVVRSALDAGVAAYTLKESEDLVLGEALAA